MTVFAAETYLLNGASATPSLKTGDILHGGGVIKNKTYSGSLKVYIDNEVQPIFDSPYCYCNLPSGKDYSVESYSAQIVSVDWSYEVRLQSFIPSVTDGSTAYDNGTTSKKSSKSAKKDDSSAKQTSQAAARAAEGRAELAAAVSNGFADTTDYYAAKEANKSAGEYYNNAVTDTPGIENAIPVSQGGNLVVDGVVTGMTATISKVDGVSLDEISRVQPGRILNVVSVSFPATEATINFYMPGVEAGANIVALQYIDGQWVDVPVVEVRADHVVLGAVKNGKVAFVLK